MEAANLQIPSAILSNLNVPQVINIMDQLPVNPKYTWAKLAGVRDINDLTYIGIHHDAWPKKNRAGVDDVKFAAEIAQDHIEYTGNEEHGDAGFPYHFWIRNGRIYQCNNVLDRTYGIGGHNGYTVHVCVSGDYHSFDALTDEDRNALYAILIALKQQLPNYKGMIGHCELNAKNCPGFDHNKVKTDVIDVEQKIAWAESDKAKEEAAYRIANTILYTYNLAKGKDEYGNPVSDGTRIWARQRLLLLEPALREHGFITK